MGLGLLSWDGAFSLGDVAALEIAPFLINKQGSVTVEGPNAYLNHSGDAVTVRNNINGATIDINVTIHNTWYKRTILGKQGGKINDDTKENAYTLAYGETHTETNKEGRDSVKWAPDSIVDTDITISLMRITQPQTDITGKPVVDASGKPVLTTTDAAGGTGTTDLQTQQYLQYAAIAAGIIIVGGIVYYLVTSPRAAPPTGGA